jgi:radical SAM superfamily enzyme YgiQ (UPF0313 family)
VKKVAEFQPDLLGISAMSFEAGELHELAAAVKKAFPKIPIVAGGPYVTTATGRAFADANLDFVARCEGEQTLLELAQYLFSGQGEPAKILGLGFRENGAARINPDRPYLENLDALPFPAWDLIPVEKYFHLPRFGTAYVHKEYMQVMTSRGCPFHCTYCHRIFGVGFRPRSPEKVLEELETLQKKFGVREIYFVDDCFNCKPSRAKRICDLIVERGLKFSINFPNGLRGDIFDAELLDKLKAAGTYRITYAVETASERMQKFIKKNLNLDQVKKAIALTDSKNMLVDGFFMIGFPGEKRSEVEQTLNFALESKLHSMNIFFVTPFEGTELYRQATELGYQVQMETDASTYFFPKSYELCEVPSPELHKMAKRSFLKFYLSPKRLWRIFRLFPNKKQLPYLFWLFLKYNLKWS